eukprot:12879870-Alexandrium_andersonii.AAC.1
MSASLVGSEMCIRDRIYAVMAVFFVDICLNFTTGYVDRNKIIMKRTRVAVSYTHLTLPTICSV